MLIFCVTPLKSKAERSYNELSQETCFNPADTKLLATREKQCQLAEKNNLVAESQLQKAIDEGFKETPFYKEPAIWGAVGLFIGLLVGQNNAKK